MPLPGEIGHDTWLDDGWRDRSGVNMWALVHDARRSSAASSTCRSRGPAANYWGGDRPGNNLFANSIVAVDAETGKYKLALPDRASRPVGFGHADRAPALVDIMQNGRTIPALASVGKTGWMFILDRVTGKPIFGVEERPVPKGDVPGEWYSPTQPFPLKPASRSSRVDFKKEPTW